MTMSTYDKGSRELAAAWLRRGSMPGARSRPAQPSCRADAHGATRPAAKPEASTIFRADAHRGFSRA